MIDYTNNFPLPELRPEGTLLQLQAYSATPSFQAVWQGEGTILDRNRIADPTAWGYDNDQREAMTRDEYYNATQLMSAEAGTNTGIYGEYINSVLGKDVNKGAVLRSIYFGADPLNAMPFGPSELPQTEEEVKELESSLNTLLAGEAGQQTDPKNPTPNQKRIKEISDKLLYKKALETTDQNLGISFSRQILAQSEWISFATDKLGITDPTETAKIARDLEDITRIRTRVDPKFNPTEWFDKTYSDPIVQQGLLDNGITSALIANAPNEDEAKFRIYRSLLQGDLQKRMATYSPTWTDNIRLASSSLVAGFVNSPDVVIDAGEIAGGTALAIGSLIASPFTGGTSLAGTVGGAAMATTGTTNLFLKLKTIWQASKALRGSYYAAETVLKLPMGFAPSYAKNLGLLGRVVTPTLMGFSGGALTEYARQQSEMAYAAATLYADPDAVKDYNMSEVAFVGIQSGMFGGALFGLAPNVVSSAFGATMNKFKGVNVAAPGEPVFRNTLDKRFTFKGTVVGEAVDYYGGILRGKKTPVAIDGPLQETLATKAELERKNPTAQEVIKETETRVDRVETSNVETPDRAESIPDTPALKRYENESKAGYIRRVAGLKEVSNIFQLVRELARRSPEASDNLKTATDDWDKMSPVDRIRVLTDASDHIKNLLDIESKLEGGLAPGRAKAIETLEKQRKTLIRNISKNLTADQIKALKKELKGEAVLELPKALAEARNNSATTAARKAAASDLAAKLVEKAQQAAKDKEQADAIRNSIPKELLDSFDELTVQARLLGSPTEETVFSIKQTVTDGVVSPTYEGIIQNAVKKALAIKKIDLARIDKVRQIIENPTALTYGSLVTGGNKLKAAKFFNFLEKMYKDKLILKEDFEFLLASTIHLNFSNKAFDIEFKIEPIIRKGQISSTIVGSFNNNTNVLTMNSKYMANILSKQSSNTRAVTVLHELGHAFFQHNANASSYLDTLKLYRATIGDLESSKTMLASSDPLIASNFIDNYILSGTEELFVETFSKILFTEGQVIIGSLVPTKVSFMQNMLSEIATSVILAAEMFQSSAHYDIATKVIAQIIDLNNELKNQISVPTLQKALIVEITNGYSGDTLQKFNARFEKTLGTSAFNLDKEEFTLLSEIVNDDPSLITVFAIAKSERKSIRTQEDFDYLIDVYTQYKKTLFYGSLWRISTYFTTEDPAALGLTDKQTRLDLIEQFYLDPLNSNMGTTGKNKIFVAAITPQELLVAGLLFRQGVNINYWDTTAKALANFMDGRNLDTKKLDNQKVLNTPLIDLLREYFNQNKLPNIAKDLARARSKQFISQLKNMAATDTAFREVGKTEVQTDTPEFRKWFADSKVLDADGKPLIVYHATRAAKDFTEFKITKDLGFHFTSNANSANRALQTRIGGKTQIGGARIYPVYLSIKNPIRIEETGSALFSDAGGWNFSELINQFYLKTKRKESNLFRYEPQQNEFDIPEGMTLDEAIRLKLVIKTQARPGLIDETPLQYTQRIYQEIREQFGTIPNKKRNSIALKRFAADVRKLGFDGFVYKNIVEGGGDSWIALDSNQIKSQFNVGTFDPTIDDIRYNIVPPKWTTVDEAKVIIADLLESKTDLATVLAVLQSQLDPNLLKTLLDNAKSESELLTGIYNGIDKGLFSYNDKSGKWEIAKKSKKKAPAKKKEVKAEVVKPAKPTKTPEQNEAEALADDSEVVTMENFKELAIKISNELNSTRNKEGYTLKSVEQALVYVSKVILDEAPELVKLIENGSVNSVAKLKKAILAKGKNVLKDEGREVRTLTRIDPVTGEKIKVKARVGSLESKTGKTIEGGRIAGRMEKINKDGLERENTIALVENIERIIQYIPNFLTEKEVELIAVLKKNPIKQDAAEAIGVDPSTVTRRDTKLRTKLDALFVDTGLTAEDLKDPVIVKEVLENWVNNKNAAVKEATTKAPKPKDVVKKEKKKTAKPMPNAEEAGARLVEVAAKAAKLANTDPPSVPVPKTTTEPTMVRVATDLTGNQLEDVVRPEVQGDALIAGTDASVKEAVKFTPKNPLKTSFQNSTDLEANPKKKAGLLAQAARGGFDAVVFQDGSMIPINKDDVVVVGRTESTTPPGIETVVTVTKEKGVPVKRTEPKPKKPKSIGDGDPVTLTKNGQPKRKQPEQKKSDVVDETEAANIERKVNEDREALRASGLDTNSLKKFLSFYWKKMKEIDKEGGTYTTLFKTMWNKFVTINAEIYEANLKLVGEDGIKAFWKKVDELRALDKHKLATVPGHKLRTDASIFAEAGRSVNDNFIPFITPNELTIKKVGEEYVFSSSVKRVRTIVAANKTEAPIPVPPTPAKPVEGAEAKPPKEVRMPEPDEDELKDRETLIEQGWQRAEQGASTPLRLTNLIGFIFGGSNRESANWWRQTMNWMRNSSQLASSTGRTIQSMQGKIRFIARMFDDVKAQTGHLVMAGKSAFRTAMQCASDEGRIIGRISKYQMRLYRNLNKMPDQRKNLMLTVWRRLSEGADLTVADVAAAGIPASMRAEITKQANDLLMIVRQVNKTFLDLEMETGLVNTVDSMGNPVDPNKWATVQLDHEKLSRLSPSERAELINKLVAARTQRKLSSELLDINTMIVLGWLDIAPSAQHQGTALLAGDRKFRRGPTVNSFDRATLSNLDTGIVHPIGIDPKKILQDLANRGEPDRFFILEENGTLKVYEIPRKVSQLSDADKAKYLDAVRGNTSLYTQRWRDYLQGKSLTEFEMIQTLDFKTKRGYYSDYNSKNGTNIDRPLMKTGTDETVALAVPGLVPEEVLAFKEITDVMRINLAESYFYFLKGRMFELLFQRELDRLMGTTGIKITDVLDWAYRSVEKDLQDMQKSQGWTKEQYEARVQELRIGLSRIREEYASYADTLPLLFNPEMYVSRASMAFMKMKVAVGYGVSALTETIIEYGKTNPLRIPSEIVKSLRYIMGDLRFSKSAILEEDAGTLLFMLENFRHEHSSRFLGEVAHGAFELDNKLRTKFINSTTPINSWDKTVRAAEVGGRVAESIGSLQALTNMVRGMGVRRWQARIWKHISKGRIQRFLAAMEDPKMARLMEQLFAGAENNPIDERRLWKQFAAEARKAGFGFDYREAMLFMTYGLNSVEKIRHLEYLIRQAGGSNRGVVNIDRMADIYWNHRNNPQPGIDNKILEEVLSSYAYFLNNITMRTTSPEPSGLGRITSLDSKTPLGRLWYALTSWIRGYQDQVILNYAYRSTLGFVAGNILLLGVVDALIGMFREWLAGRETEDMLEEFEENPESFAIRVLRAAPIMGAANGIFEGVLSGINALSGGVWRSYNNPMSSIGINAAASSIEDIGRGMSELTGQITGEDPIEPAKLVAAGGKIIPYNSLFNRSPIAVPARFIEDMGYLDQRGAVQQYLNLIQREPYPYAKSKGKAGRAGASAITMQPPPRNIAKEMAEFERLEAARPKVSQSLKDTIKTEIVNDQKGVSGRLGELLK